MTRSLRRGCLAAALIATVLVGQADWPQWRGPTRDGVIPAKNVPITWPEEFHRVWEVEVGEGYASPVVSGSRVFVHSRHDPEEKVTALDLRTGKAEWTQSYVAVHRKNQYAARIAKGPHATPLVWGQRLFTLGATAVCKAWNLQTGELLWTRDFSATADTSSRFYGTAASPLAWDNSIIVQTGSDTRGGQITALDQGSGETRWVRKGPGPGYASPMAIEIGGMTHLVTLTERSVVGLDIKTGDELWSIPFPDEWNENIVTPAWTGALLVISGIRRSTRAYSLRQVENRWEVTPQWDSSDAVMYMSSPVYLDGVIYGHSPARGGRYFAMDARTGNLRWITETPEGQHASTLVTSRHVVFLSQQGTLKVARTGTPEFQLERTYELGIEEAWATPVLLGDRILVRHATRLALFAAEAKE